jgi:formylglycine-generating enzyme required for sulfatase activity/class 3 adenylate cyclase/predicted Ser/Thr protein kinase
MDLYVENIDQLLRARSEIDEELRRHKTKVTVLFTDVVGSTTYFDRFGDTAGLLLLHRHDNLVTTAVDEFRGIVVKTIGDSVMAEFPEPLLAVRAAIAMQQRLLEENESVVESERLRIRTGINYGAGFRRGNDLFGDAINLAARITKRSEPAQILISHAVREALAETDICCKSVGRVGLEGKAETEQLYEVIWTNAILSEHPRLMVPAACGMPTPAELRSIPLTRFTAGELSAAPELERYEILARLGVGGMGLVFKARDRETGEIVALKVLKSEIADQPALMEAFKNELRIARKITHKNVCRIYDFNRTDGISFITMEFVEGESLRGVLNRFRALSTRTGLKIAEQICDALREAHAQGVVHRDLKPENLMIDGSGNVKLMDFGLAHLVAESSTSAAGTPSYMAPEQAQGSPLDQRCDIYTFGLILFEMFTGSAAFTGDTPMAVALKQIQDVPANPRSVQETIPDHVAMAILRCLEKDPAKRFQSVGELQAALAGETASQKIGSLWKGASRPAFGPAMICGILIVVTLIMLGLRVAPKPPVDSTPSDAEFAAFHMAESLNTEEAWTTFLKNYRKGELVWIARQRAESLRLRQQESAKNTAASNVVPAVPAEVTKPAESAPRPKWAALVDTVVIPGGVFMMGSDSGRGDEKPQHQVRLDGFRMSRFEITNRQYRAFLEDTGGLRPKDPAFARNYLMAYPDLPVVNVSYQDAVAFCTWAGTKFGVAVRLPTEAEWEYAALGRNGNGIAAKSHSARNDFGLFNMNGNVGEWVSDFYSKDYYMMSPVKNPAGPTSGTKRVIRGVSGDERDNPQVAIRRRTSRGPKEHGDQIGFRVVVDIHNRR